MTSHFGDPETRLKPFLELGFASRAIHGGQHPDPITGAVMPPIVQNSTYAQREAGKPLGEFEYSRTHNPTRRILEDALSLLENGTYGLAMSSGMAATSLILNLYKPGDEIVCCDDVYGGTYRLFTKILEPQGYKFRFVDLAEVSKIEESITKNTKLVWVETPTNPLLKLIDIRKVAARAKAVGAKLAVDNTFMSPYFQKPLDLGADFVLHSLTKYINGHSDVVGGCVITRDKETAEKLYFHQNSIGAVLGPFDSWLVVRSLKTLPVRMKAHGESAQELAEWLEKHPKVSKVIYPGLKSHPQHALAKDQMSGFGGMLSFYLKGGLEDAQSLLRKVKVFTLAESLGGVESLIEHPAIMTHASVPKEIREKNGIADSFLRVSVGLEDLEDLKRDLQRAFG
ncbi:MAG: PLP-dependent aspartate aminotransferase family protein [Bdellovibrionota bacterium]